jgi:RHS repeat-associated protein
VYTYTKDKRVASISRPGEAKQTVFQYSDFSDKLQRVDFADDNWVEYQYDEVTAEQWGEDSGRTGKLMEMTSSYGVDLQFAYLGDLLREEVYHIDGLGAFTVTNTYDHFFRPVHQIIDDSTVTRLYQNGQVSQMGALGFQRRALDGQIDSTQLQNVSSQLMYSGFGEYEGESFHVGGSDIWRTSLEHDEVGRISSKTEAWQGDVATVESYEYDPAGRLSRVSREGGGSTSYTYDTNGNRLWKAEDGRVWAGEYSVQDRLEVYCEVLLPVLDDDAPCMGALNYTTYSYTDAGDLRMKQVYAAGEESEQWTYEYATIGNLRFVEKATLEGGVPVCEFRIEYLLDGLNRRVGRVKSDCEGEVLASQFWVYDGGLNPIAEFDGNGTRVARFVYGSRMNVPDYVERNGVLYRIAANHLGSPVAVIHAGSGEVVQEFSYDAFGVSETFGEVLIPFGFAGGLVDGDTGLVRFGARDYDPQTGRWTQMDPIRFAGGDPNLYGYVMSDPVNWIDPEGEVANCWFWKGFYKYCLDFDLVPSKEEDLRRNRKNNCPDTKPDKFCTERPYEDRGGKTRFLDGSECIYNDNDQLVRDGSFNFGPNPLSLKHVCADVVPWCLWKQNYGKGAK